MLPDLPDLKNDIQHVLTKYLQHQINMRLGVFNESPRHTAHEGNRMRVIRADGSMDDSDFKESSSQMTIKIEEVSKLTVEERLARINSVADDMANQMSQHLFGRLKEAIDKTGNVVDRKGQPFTADAVFEMLEKMELEFDDSGKHHNLSIVLHPDVMPRAKAVFEQIESDAALNKRYEKIMERKRVEWRDREASRKLVG